MKQTKFVLERSNAGLIYITKIMFNKTNLCINFKSPNGDGIKSTKFLESLKEGERIEIKLVATNKLPPNKSEVRKVK